MKSKSKGFTLVELLVVIGIIALLISILLPALNRSRAQAKVVQCSSLMRQIVLATRAYAAENKDSLPPKPLDLGQATFNVKDKAPGETVVTLRAFTHQYFTYKDPEAAGKEEGANIGRLVFKGYLRGDLTKMTTCPNNLDQANLGWGGYIYNPHLAIRTYNSTDYQQTWWKKASQYGRALGTREVQQVITPYGRVANFSFPGKKWALVTDPLFTASTGSVTGYLPHQVGASYVANLAQIDGSVASVYSKKARGNVQTYGQLKDLLTYLELLSDDNAGAAFPNNPASVIPVNP